MFHFYFLFFHCFFYPRLLCIFIARSSELVACKRGTISPWVLVLPLFPDAPWAILLASIEPESTAVTVNGLIPARSYQFRLCAVNDVGKGQFSKETDR